MASQLLVKDTKPLIKLESKMWNSATEIGSSLSYFICQAFGLVV